MSIFALDEMATFLRRSSQESDNEELDKVICELFRIRILLTFRRIEIIRSTNPSI